MTTMVKSKAAQAATRKYESNNYDVVRVLFPKGTKDRIKATGQSVNGFTVSAVLSRLDEIQVDQTQGPE